MIKLSLSVLLGLILVMGCSNSDKSGNFVNAIGVKDSSAVLFPTSGHNTQNFKERLKAINSENQECLDKGIAMLGCSYNYYGEIDSLLNLVYVDIRHSMTKQETLDLKDEQLVWLKIRDKEFVRIDNEETELGEGGFNESRIRTNDDVMVRTMEKAQFVIKRIEYLIDKYKSELLN